MGDKNDAPVFCAATATTTRNIAENSAAGTEVGAAVTVASNPNNYDLTHVLGGDDASDLDIVASSGQTKVKSALNYESKKKYSVTVKAPRVARGHRVSPPTRRSTTLCL